MNEHIISALKDLGCRVDGYRFCPYVTSDYAEKAALKGRRVAARYIDDHARCLKPDIGMLEDAAAMFGMKLGGLRHGFVIGDRVSDIEMGIRTGWTSLFIESSKARQENEKGKILAMQEWSPGAIVIATISSTRRKRSHGWLVPKEEAVSF